MEHLLPIVGGESVALALTRHFRFLALSHQKYIDCFDAFAPAVLGGVKTGFAVRIITRRDYCVSTFAAEDERQPYCSYRTFDNVSLK
jgi:hypothetical protein